MVVAPLPLSLTSLEDRREAEGVDFLGWEEGSRRQASGEVEAQPPCHREAVAYLLVAVEGEEDLRWEEVVAVPT